MKRNKLQTYLFQFNFQSDNTVYLPYSLGVLWAYASQSELVKTHYNKPQFVFVKEKPEIIVSAMDDPDTIIRYFPAWYGVRTPPRPSPARAMCRSSS